MKETYLIDSFAIAYIPFFSYYPVIEKNMLIQRLQYKRGLRDVIVSGDHLKLQ